MQPVEVEFERQKNLRMFVEKWSLPLSLEILNEATTHSSFSSISPEVQDYQRLETLGDSVLDLLVVEWFINHGLDTESTLTEARSEVVKNTALAEFSREIGLGNILRSAPTQRISKKMYADVLEAVFGALFVENGLDACRNLLNDLFLPRLERILELMKKGWKRWGQGEQNYRNIIDEFFRKDGQPPPEFTLEQEDGPPHLKLFKYRAQVFHQGSLLKGCGKGATKKEARQKAARSLCKQLGLLTTED
ncbi:MAG: ribonuclease III family protein [Candidatus Heimdallarchaeota archaeon]